MVIFSYLLFPPCALWADLPFQHPGSNGKLSPSASPCSANSLCALLLWASSWWSRFPHLLPGNPLCPVHALLEVSRHREPRSPHQHPDTPTAGSLAEPQSSEIICPGVYCITETAFTFFLLCSYILRRKKVISRTRSVTAQSQLPLSDNCRLPVVSANHPLIILVYPLCSPLWKYHPHFSNSHLDKSM